MLTPERWQKVRDVLEQALELAPEKRSRFLDVACSSDPTLRSEVQSLLSSDDQARTSFLETPPVLPAALTPGTRLGDYEILSQIGSGGMGVVYRARDARLGRLVAIKVLPAHLSSDSDRLKRFEQEAQSAAALNHPNILAVYQLGSFQGSPYLVSELLEGETLRDHLKHGLISQERALDYAQQIAAGLSAAHERGIIHRDLKPENLFVTNDNRIKILDFGLAKLSEADSGSAETVATLGLQTHPGMIAGTVGYMSPEQVRGEKLDTRTDLFSFGVVLYEMATGKRPFDGDTSGVTFEAILNRQPTPPTKLNTKVAPGLENIITKALEKDREIRYQHASDIRADLKRLKRDSESGHTASPAVAPPKNSRRIYWLVSLAVLILAASAILLYTLPWVRSGPKRQLVQRDLTANPSDYAVTGAAISPDGKQLAYSDRKNGITLLQIDSGEKRILIGPDMLDVLDWYPDGTHLLIGGEHKGGLWKLSTFDGKKQQVLDENEGVFTAAVSPDGTQIAFVKRPVFNEIWMIGPQGGVPRRIFVKDSKLNVYIHSIAWSPTSRRIIYSWQEIGESGAPIGGISTFNLETGQESAIYSDRNLISQSGATSVSWSSDGRLFFALREPSPNQLDTNLWVLVVDPRTGQVKGAPSRVTNGTGFTQDGLSQSLKEDRLIFEKLKVQHTILIGEIKKQTGDLQNVATLAGDTWSKWDFQWSGDGQSVVYGTYRQGKYVIYRENLRTYEAEELVAPDGTEHIFFPALTSDGRWMFYTRMFDQGTTDTLSELMRIPARGGAPSKVLSGSFSYRCAALTNACVVLEYHGKERSFAQLDPVSGSGPVFARVNDFAYPADRGWSLSADGRRIAYLPTYGSEIKVLSIDGKETTTITVLDSRLQSLSWAPDNTHIYATRASDAGFDVLRVDLDGKFKSLFKVPVNAGWILNPVPSPDGRYLAIPLSTYETNVTLLENF